MFYIFVRLPKIGTLPTAKLIFINNYFTIIIGERKKLNDNVLIGIYVLEFVTQYL